MSWVNRLGFGSVSVSRENGLGTTVAKEWTMNNDKQLKIDALCLRAVRAVRAAHKTTDQRLDAICDRLNSVDAERVFWVGKEIGNRYESALAGLIDAPDTYDTACSATSLMLAIQDYEIEILKDSPAEKAIKPIADLIRACRE